jgi:anti-sigma factor RsiW
MHAVVMENVEEFLAGTLEPVERRTIEAHLASCATCREELQQMEDVSLLFSSLSAHEMPEPAPGFYARVMQQVSEQRVAPSWMNLFALSPDSGRRLALACSVILVALGTFLVSNELRYSAGPMPDAVMAEQSQPAFDSAPASENMLVTLANYEH